MERDERTLQALRIGTIGSVLTLVGIPLSGPVGLLLVNETHPQPMWQNAQTFAANFHFFQTFPFFAGFALIVGYLMILAALHQLAHHGDRVLAFVGILFAAIYASLIFFNYICQTTFVPSMAQHYAPEYDTAIATFSMSNPRSLAWGVEMWGYAALGVAMWFAAPVLHRTPIERMVSKLMMLNGIISITGGILTSVNSAWVFSAAGYWSYGAWNLLVFVLSAAVFGAFQQRMKNHRRSDESQSGDPL